MYRSLLNLKKDKITFNNALLLQGKLGVPGLPGYPGRQGPKVSCGSCAVTLVTMAVILFVCLKNQGVGIKARTIFHVFFLDNHVLK